MMENVFKTAGRAIKAGLIFALYIYAIFTSSAASAQEIENTADRQRQNVNATEIDVVTFAGKSEKTKMDNIGAGMEVVEMQGLNIVVPKGAKIRREANRIYFEDTGEYLARRFDEMEKRFAQIEARQEELKKEIAQLKQSVQDKDSRLLE